MPPFFCYEKVHGSSNSFHSLGVLLILKKLANLLKARQKKKSWHIIGDKNQKQLPRSVSFAVNFSPRSWQSWDLP